MTAWMKLLFHSWIAPLTKPLILIGIPILVVGMWRFYARQPVRGQRGSTLVMAGLALFIAGIFIEAKSRESQRSRLSGCRYNLSKAISTGLEMYRNDYGKLPSSLADLTPTYLRKVPFCPVAGSDTYSQTYIQFPTSQGMGYRVACGGRHHAGAGILSEDQPLYHGNYGSHCETDPFFSRVRHRQEK